WIHTILRRLGRSFAGPRSCNLAPLPADDHAALRTASGERLTSDYLVPGTFPTGEANRFFRGAEQRPRLVLALLIFRRRITVRDDPHAGLRVENAVLHDRRP